MKLPKLKGSAEFGEGQVVWPEDWSDNGSLLRADLLKDWIGELTYAYNQALIQMRKGEYDGPN